MFLQAVSVMVHIIVGFQYALSTAVTAANITKTPMTKSPLLRRSRPFQDCSPRRIEILEDILEDIRPLLVEAMHATSWRSGHQRSAYHNQKIFQYWGSTGEDVLREVHGNFVDATYEVIRSSAGRIGIYCHGERNYEGLEEPVCDQWSGFGISVYTQGQYNVIMLVPPQVFDSIPSIRIFKHIFSSHLQCPRFWILPHFTRSSSHPDDRVSVLMLNILALTSRHNTVDFSLSWNRHPDITTRLQPVHGRPITFPDEPSRLPYMYFARGKIHANPCSNCYFF